MRKWYASNEQATELLAHLREVSKEDFFASLNADPRDIMPTVCKADSGIYSDWALNNNRSAPLWGRSVDVALDDAGHVRSRTRYALVEVAR